MCAILSCAEVPVQEGGMIECAGTVLIYVHDKALDFYVNKPGLEKRADETFGLPDKGDEWLWN
jgi:hypothetical protein